MANVKDWKVEYDKLKGELIQVQKQLDYERQQRERREWKSEELRNTFKELLLEVLGT